MIALIEAINVELMDFAPDHVTDPKKAFYRIYRDTRFSTDKTPYKTHIAAIFPRRNLHKHASAGFYFQISPKEVGIAAGMYMPGPECEPSAHFSRSIITSSAKWPKGPEDFAGQARRKRSRGYRKDSILTRLLRTCFA